MGIENSNTNQFKPIEVKVLSESEVAFRDYQFYLQSAIAAACKIPPNMIEGYNETVDIDHEEV